MTISAPFVLPKARALTDGVVASPGAKLYFFNAGTSNALTVYQDVDATTPHAIPVVADSAGRFAPIYTPNGVAFKYELRDAAGTLIEQADNVPGPFDPTNVEVEFAKAKAPILAKTGSYTITASDLGKAITGDTTAGSIAFTLPSGAASADKVVFVEKLGSANTLTMQAGAGDVIYGPNSSGSTFQLNYAGEWAMMVGAPGSWRVFTSRPAPSSITSDLLSSAISGSFMKAGVVVAWPAAHGSVPSGYLYCNGAAVSRSTYAELFGVIGTFYGTGDGSTTFNLPDFRGQFLRGQADGQSTDPDRASRTNRGDGTTGDAVGTKQATANLSHTHTGTTSTDGAHAHTVTGASNGAYGSDIATAATAATQTTSTAGSHTHTFTTAAAGGNESRPPNVYIRYYIFAGSSIAAGASAGISVLLNGLGDPSDALGADGDFYIDRASGKIWGAKASGSWTGTSFRIAVTQGRPWKFSTTTTDADPGAGFLRLNSATMASVTQMYISETDGDGNSAATLLAGWLGLGSSTTRGTLTIEKVMAAGTYASFAVSGSLTDAGVYDKITLSHLGSAGTFAANDAVTVGFTPAGAAGSAGATGATGPNVGLDYAWSTSTSGDPGSGKVLVNNATPSSATQVNISESNRQGSSQATYIASWDDSTTTSARGVIRIVDVSAPGTNYLEYLITGAMTDAGSYDTFPVSYLGGAGTIANATIIAVAHFRTGDAGGGMSSITPGAGLTSTVTATAPGSAITSSGTLSQAQLVNAQTGTSYTILDGDRAKLVTFSNASSIAVTLPQAGAASAFQSGWFCDIENKGAGTVTITPTTSTIDGGATLVVKQNLGVRIFSDGTNYQVMRGGQGNGTAALKDTGTSGGNVPLMSGQNAWSGQQTSTLATLTDAASVAWDVSTAQKAKVTLGGNRTMSAVTNAVEGTTYFLWAIQDATGSRTLSWTTSGAGSFDFGAPGAPTLTTTASRADLLTFEALSIGGTLKLRYMGIQKGFA